MNETTHDRVIDRTVREGLARFDADYGLMRVRRRVHHHTVDVPDGWYHETRDTAYLALALLERAAREYAGESGDDTRTTKVPAREELVATASRIIAALHTAQYTDNRDAAWYGLWHYYADVPVPDWAYKDYNWADFIAVALLQIAARHADRLSRETMTRLRECVDRAAACVLRRNVRPSYTNISALATYVLVGAGELVGSDAYRAAGRQRALAMAELVESAAIDEYFSPGYTGVALMGLLSVRNFTRDDAAREAARRIELRLWSHLADGWHPGSRELSGPHSRAYTVRMGFSWVAALLYRATAGELDWPDPETGDETGGDFLKVSCLVQDVDLPADLARRFTRPQLPRDVEEPGEQHPTDAGPRRTWYRARLTEPWCLGTVDLQDSRTDRQNVLAYWAPSGSMIVRTRKDDGEGAFGLYVCADQDLGDALVGVFPGGFDDPSPMRPRDGADAAWLDTVAVVENADPMEVEELGGDSRAVLVRCGETDLALWPVFHERIGEPRITVSDDRKRLELRWVWYEGERRRVRWDELAGGALSLLVSFREPDERAAAWRTRLLATRRAAGRSDDGSEWLVKADRSARRSLSLRMPRETLPMQTLYARSLRA